MKHLLWVVGLAALIPAVMFFVKFSDAPANQGRNDLLLSVVFLVISLICWAMFFFNRFREEGKQDISITKF
jgi:hypothetical protein